jgi:hypothetical protein
MTTAVTATFGGPPPPAGGADLTINNFAPAEVAVRRSMSYGIGVRNNGPETATDVVVTDVLPDDFAFSDAAEGCRREDRTVTCTWASLASGTISSRFISGRFEVAERTISNTARISSSTHDPDGSNNASTATVRTTLHPPPFVSIDEPLDGALFERSDLVSVSGRIETLAGRTAFCVTADVETMPARCVGAPTSGDLTRGRFEDLDVAAVLAPGPHVIRVWTRDREGRTASDLVRITVASMESGLDVSALALEITQGIQELRTPRPERFHSIAGLTSPHLGRRYDGVPLVAGKRHTAVLLYATADATARLTRLRGVKAALWGFRDGAPLPGSPLLPAGGPRDLGVEPWPETRYRPGGAYVFILPFGWTHGTVTLVGEVNPAVLTPRIPECGLRCTVDNLFALTNVSFTRAQGVDVFSVAMTYRVGGETRRPPDRPGPVYDSSAKLLPAAAFFAPPYEATIDITEGLDGLARDNGFDTLAACLRDPEPDEDENCAERASRYALRRCVRWNDANPRRGKTMCLQRGLRGRAYVNSEPGIAEPERPITSVAHELVHMLGRQHASDCGDGGGGDWPPDERGYIQGIGLDIDPGTGATRVLAPDYPDVDTQFYDLMSYCAGGATAWMSVRNWNELFTPFSRAFASVAAPLAVGPTLLVRATVGADGTASIDHVGGGGRDVTTSAPGARYSLVARDAAGAVVSSASVAPRPESGHAAPGHTVGATLPVPTQGIASVELVADGRVLASRRRSSAAPTVRVTAPRAGARLPSRGTVRVGWAATDANGDRLEAAVDYSANGGRTWRTVTISSGSSATLPARLFSRSRNARIRVTVNDGFDETRAVSGRLSAVGAPPVVRIVAPARAVARIAADTPLLLAGEASNDQGRRLAGGRLRWFAGTRAIGTGPTLTAPLLPPGRRTIRLVARDLDGRTAEARVVVAVRAVRPAFLRLRTPTRVSPSATRLTFTTGATVPATLRVGGLRFDVGRRPRAVSVAIRPGRGPLQIRLTLSAGGRSTQRTLRIRRS